MSTLDIRKTELQCKSVLTDQKEWYELKVLELIPYKPSKRELYHLKLALEAIIPKIEYELKTITYGDLES